MNWTCSIQRLLCLHGSNPRPPLLLCLWLRLRPFEHPAVRNEGRSRWYTFGFNWAADLFEQL